jgi:hypothetical protein
MYVSPIESLLVASVWVGVVEVEDADAVSVSHLPLSVR